ncbi:hypothetical protein ES705_27298 [subsurface metagenome]
MLDSKNEIIYRTINWLTEKCDEIYGDLYYKFEFQLGLMKEFLQVVWSSDTVPYSKGAVALITAHDCMLQANEEVVNG